ncbi:transcriptional regulator [Methanothermobacter thermautotrophicus]|uniref:Transcriptional regulator n=1 Tax=Methanothermobacter thermautotrophicus TaxID=145262 RepID=A0A842YMH3_METTF|nr:winged helix-turn-helix transcriptional regulator [Methanothermobacter thermautotrophicus]MBE2900128.1 transcriptional regulator [Methanothermobacter thermautotrophicus]MCQ8904432.1 winged helix-turn-helix transcriptional regulator [Methanothermobacter sp.]
MEDDEYLCSVEVAINEIGGKWKSLVLCALKDGKLRFSEINRRIPKITQRMLTRTLRELESSALIKRKVYPEVPPRVEYCLTEKGKSVIPILDALCEWGKQYGSQEYSRDDPN